LLTELVKVITILIEKVDYLRKLSTVLYDDKLNQMYHVTLIRNYLTLEKNTSLNLLKTTPYL